MKPRTIVIILITACAALTLSGCHGRSEDVIQSSRDNGALADFIASRRLPVVLEVKPWQWRGHEGVEIHTRSYRIFTTLQDYLVVAELPAFMEAAHREYQRQLPRTIETRLPFKVYLFADRAQWEDFTDEFTGREARLYKQITRGAYVAKGDCVAWFLGRNQTFSILAHEGWHQFTSRHFALRLPSWLDEGIATLFEAPVYDRGTWRFEPQRNVGRLAGLKKTMLEGQLLSLEQLLSLNPGQVVSEDSSQWRAFYSQAYALVRFLREEDYGRYLGRYHAMLTACLDGTWPLDAHERRALADRNVRMTADKNARLGLALFENYLGSPSETLEQKYQAFCRKITYRIQLRETSGEKQ